MPTPEQLEATYRVFLAHLRFWEREWGLEPIAEELLRQRWDEGRTSHPQSKPFSLREPEKEGPSLEERVARLEGQVQGREAIHHFHHHAPPPPPPARRAAKPQKPEDIQA